MTQPNRVSVEKRALCYLGDVAPFLDDSGIAWYLAGRYVVKFGCKCRSSIKTGKFIVGIRGFLVV